MPFVPSFRSNTSNASSFMLSFFLCTSGTVDDDDDTFSSSYVPYSMRVEAQSQLSRNPSTTLKKSKTKSKKNSKMVIGSPTDFRHDVHLGNDYKTDLSYTIWDSERWRQELMRKNLFLPPLVEPSRTDDIKEPLSPSSNPNANKRNSITPQKRKPVPPLSEPLPPTPTAEPHEIPLPPSPTESSQTFEDALSQAVSSEDEGTFSDFSLPSLAEHSSRGPSMDIDFPPSPKRTSEEQTREQEHEPVKSLEIHVDT